MTVSCVAEVAEETVPAPMPRVLEKGLCIHEYRWQVICKDRPHLAECLEKRAKWEKSAIPKRYIAFTAPLSCTP